MKCLVWALPIVLVTSLGGCRSSSSEHAKNYQTVATDPGRDTKTAKEKSRQAAEMIKQDELSEAEKCLKEALAADVMYGPAHNNLGLVYFKQNQLYLAAWEFQYAIKLLPKKPEPYNNLGLVYEAGGKFPEAIQSYSQAVAIQPDNPQFLGNEVRARIRNGEKGKEVRKLLSDLLMHETRPQWIQWAKQEMVLIKENR
jgi:Tfp pilus assembly protein PilF